MTGQRWDGASASEPSRPIILEGRVVDEQVTITDVVTPGARESFWGAGASRLGRRLLFVGLSLVAAIVIIPLVLLAFVILLIASLLGRRAMARNLKARGFDIRGFDIRGFDMRRASAAWTRQTGR